MTHKIDPRYKKCVYDVKLSYFERSTTVCKSLHNMAVFIVQSSYPWKEIFRKNTNKSWLALWAMIDIPETDDAYEFRNVDKNNRTVEPENAFGSIVQLTT